MTLALTLESVMHQWAMSEKPTVRPELYRGQGRKWHIKLVEEWQSVDDAGNRYSSGDLDKRVDWTVQTLETWKTAHRTAWDIWFFDNKRDAEKFITMYYLVWAK